MSDPHGQQPEPSPDELGYWERQARQQQRQQQGWDQAPQYGAPPPRYGAYPPPYGYGQPYVPVPPTATRRRWVVTDSPSPA